MHGIFTYMNGLNGKFEETYIFIHWVVPPPRMPVANEGLGWDPRT